MNDTGTLFDLLAAAPRRQLLIALCDVESVAIPEGLRVRGATASAQPQADTATDGPPAADVSSDELALYHSHLPKLADCGLIEWDPETQTASRGPEFGTVEPLLYLLAENAHVLPNDFF